MALEGYRVKSLWYALKEGWLLFLSMVHMNFFIFGSLPIMFRQALQKLLINKTSG